MDVGDLMKMAGQMRDQLRSAQQEAQNLQVSAESGGGLVKIVMNGQHEVVNVSLDKSCVTGPQDLPLLEDLVRAAVNQAVAEVGLRLKDRMGGLAKGMGVDMSAFAGSDKAP